MTGHVFTASPLLTVLLHSLAQQYLKLWIPAIPYKYSIRSKYPCWFSSTIKYYMPKKYLFYLLQKD
jgi:hypothetical protein